LQIQLEQALAKIEQKVQKNKDLARRISRSPRAIQKIQALEAAIAIFGQNKPNPEYEVSEYATGNRRWKCSPAQHLVPIQDLLLYDVQNKHNQNKILGDRVVEVVRQNIQLAQQVSIAYETPSEKLKKDPIMGLVTKTVATYMFLTHNNEMSKDGTTTRRWRTFQNGGNHFSKRRSESESRNNRIKNKDNKDKESESKQNNSKRKLKGENRTSKSQKKRYKKIGNKKSERESKGESIKSESQKKGYKKRKRLKLN
jgi:hypothetical protein